jgi:hypothetical protein
VIPQVFACWLNQVTKIRPSHPEVLEFFQNFYKSRFFLCKSPLVFIIFINDLEHINTFSELYADDTKLVQWVLDEFDQMQVQGDIDKIVDWSDKWRLI